ncbi:hypothetical protein PSTEL_11295 [Paenibacillus stellifer]|uniref:Uncharacterized protein n=1 Tax=Paenibacillus stellifer TaxID=169760 RepID=A0A089LWF2_9BACL|nr:YqhG family protein [Paenibacillus stellifer]AIQ63578.1 hypothetical protein PSTEL_11295 [Paenibacillus stellifer]
MTLTPKQVQSQVMEYLMATDCQIIEKSPVHVTVKLSPRADRMLTDRPYYWGFVERTGAEPETLSFTFVFDPETYDAVPGPRSAGGRAGGPGGAGTPHGTGGPGSPAPVPGPQAAGGRNPVAGFPAPGVPAAPGPGGAGSPPGADRAGAPAPQPGTAPGVSAAQQAELPAGVSLSGNTLAGTPQEGILSRYFGVAPLLPRLGPGLIRREDVVFGSKRLRQIWAAARSEGRCLYLFEEPGAVQRRTIFPAAYEPWLAVCFKIELSCDLKREELHFIGVSLLSGEIRERFEHTLEEIPMTPRVPENIHVQPSELTLDEGAQLLERHITAGLAVQDYSWAMEARKRLDAELQIIDAYYQELIRETDEERRGQVEEQYQSRRRETSWQYKPHIAVSPVVYGLFHLRSRPQG